MPQAYLHADLQRVYRTRALGTIAELVVTDERRADTGVGAARGRAGADRPRGQPVPE